jgi:hypothetical protein
MRLKFHRMGKTRFESLSVLLSQHLVGNALRGPQRPVVNGASRASASVPEPQRKEEARTLRHSKGRRVKKKPSHF